MKRPFYDESTNPGNGWRSPIDTPPQPKGELVLRDVHGVNGPAGALCVIRFKTLNAARLAAKLLQRDDPKLCAYARHVARPSPLMLRLGFDCGDAHDQGVIDGLTRGRP